jgi:hypothetical protein
MTILQDSLLHLFTLGEKPCWSMILWKKLLNRSAMALVLRHFLMCNISILWQIVHTVTYAHDVTSYDSCVYTTFYEGHNYMTNINRKLIEPFGILESKWTIDFEETRLKLVFYFNPSQAAERLACCILVGIPGPKFDSKPTYQRSPASCGWHSTSDEIGPLSVNDLSDFRSRCCTRGRRKQSSGFHFNHSLCSDNRRKVERLTPDCL